jgi:uncharacterized protein
LESWQKIFETIPGSKGRPITVDVFFIPDGKPKPVVIFSHGFKGFKDWGHFNLLGAIFAERGFTFVKFNFSYNGTTPGNLTSTDDLEAFGNNNYLIELGDLGLVIDWVCNEFSERQQADPNRIYLLGHSRGGGVSILKAASDPRVKKLVTWASVSDFLNRNSPDTIRRWEKEGVVHTTNARTGQQLPLYFQFYKSLIENRAQLDITKSASGLKIPYLIIHAADDEAVPVKEARALHKAARSSELLILDTGGHTFGVRHPFEELVLPPISDMVTKRTIEFFIRDF